MRFFFSELQENTKNSEKKVRIISEMQVLNLELRGINAHLQNKSELWEIN